MQRYKFNIIVNSISKDISIIQGRQYNNKFLIIWKLQSIGSSLKRIDDIHYNIHLHWETTLYRQSYIEASIIMDVHNGIENSQIYKCTQNCQVTNKVWYPVIAWNGIATSMLTVHDLKYIQRQRTTSQKLGTNYFRLSWNMN